MTRAALILVALAALAPRGFAEEPSRAQRCMAAFEAARDELGKSWKTYRKIDVSLGKEEVLAFLELQDDIVYMARFGIGQVLDDKTGPEATGWTRAEASTQRQFASGFGIISLGARRPDAVPKSALKRLPAFMAAYQKAIETCAR